MRVDRSRFRVVRQLQRGGDQDGWVGCVFALGTVQFEVWPKTPRSEIVFREWLDYIFLPGPATYDEVLEQIEQQFLTEELPKLSAHQRLSLIRQGLLISDAAT